MEITITPLSEEILDDFLAFFDNMDFPDHPDWKNCYCYSYHFTGTAEEWEQEGKNRAAAIELIKRNHMRGYLAYNETGPIGWCNVNDKDNYERLKLDDDIMNTGGGKICSIVCFVINPAHRRKGVASKILERICIDYQNRGYAYIEAYPRKNSSNDEENYHGPENLYEKSGFSTVKELADFTVVRKKLMFSADNRFSY